MIILTAEQFSKICPKQSRMGQCEWFRNKYGCTLIIRNSSRYKQEYRLEFNTDKEETFFRLQYSDALSFNPKWDAEAELLTVIKSWQRH